LAVGRSRLVVTERALRDLVLAEQCDDRFAACVKAAKSKYNADRLDIGRRRLRRVRIDNVLMNEAHHNLLTVNDQRPTANGVSGQEPD
jgi:hypothetical protein